MATRCLIRVVGWHSNAAHMTIICGGVVLEQGEECNTYTVFIISMKPEDIYHNYFPNDNIFQDLFHFHILPSFIWSILALL